MADALLSPSFLFRFSVAGRYSDQAENAFLAAGLGVEHRLPSFRELEGKRVFADVRCGWHETGLAWEVVVTGKKQSAWCREARLDDSDGVNVWIDTRDSRNIHRANRFCHRFVFLPTGGGARGDQPVAAMLPINRARELPKPVERGVVLVRGGLRGDGYSLRAWIPAAALTGYDVTEHRRIGVCYAVVDRELGWQTFSLGPEFPFVEDPTLWGTLELERA